MNTHTDIDALIAEAFKVAKKGVQINDGHTYNVHAHDLVEYSETIMVLMDALESTAAELRQERELTASLAQLVDRDTEAELARAQEVIEKVRHVAETPGDYITTRGAIQYILAAYDPPTNREIRGQ